jgi:hypothetical protein
VSNPNDLFVANCAPITARCGLHCVVTRASLVGLPCLAGKSGLRRGRTERRIERGTRARPSSMLARFVLALASKRKPGTALAGSRKGTTAIVSVVGAAVGAETLVSVDI